MSEPQRIAVGSSEARWAWLFLAPCLLGLIVFTYIPIVASLGLSFSYWNLLGSPEWVGLDNYRAVLGDPLFWRSLGTTGFFVFVSALIEVVLGLLLAVWLNGAIRGQAAFRTAYFLPFITPMVSVALVWGWLFDPQAGLINWLLTQTHVIEKPVAWLYDPQTAMWVIILLRVWKDVGYNIVIFLAGLQAVSPSLYESAELDGARPLDVFLRITVPMITPTLFFVTVMAFINGFQAFDAVYLLTQGGPEHSTELLVYWMFKNAFEFYKIGPASAIAYLLFLIILALTAWQWQLRKRWVMYEDEGDKA